MAQKAAPAGLIFFGTFHDTEHLAKAIFGYTDGHKNRYIAHLIGPGAL
jgi:hypothetical protein